MKELTYNFVKISFILTSPYALTLNTNNIIDVTI